MDRISGIRRNIQDEIDAIWRKAYNAGYEDGYAVGGNDAKREISLSGEYERAYQKGLEDGKEFGKIQANAIEYQKGYEEGQKAKVDVVHSTEVDEAYKKGLEEAWEVARKICVEYTDDKLMDIGFDPAERKFCDAGEWDMYEYSCNVIGTYTASEAKEKIEAWEQKQKVKKNCLECKYSDDRDVDICYDCEIGYADGFERNADEIEVGDEVIFENEHRAVVAHVDFGNQDYFDIIFANGETSYVSQDDVIKTGRHFNGIAEVLKQMRGES